MYLLVHTSCSHQKDEECSFAHKHRMQHLESMWHCYFVELCSVMPAKLLIQCLIIACQHIGTLASNFAIMVRSAAVLHTLLGVPSILP